MHALFITGTDTDVGKTLVSAWLASSCPSDYWKPIQSGHSQGTDSATIAQLAPDTFIHPSTYTFEAPLSPHAAASEENVQIRLADFVLPRSSRPLIVEGAGGILVPLNENSLMVDLIVHLGLPVLLVARSSLGTINHTLLSLEALRTRGIPILGVVMNGFCNAGNRRSIENFGNIPVLAEIKPLPKITPKVLASLPRPSFFMP